MRLVYNYLYVLCTHLNKLYVLRAHSTPGHPTTHSPHLTPPKGKFIPPRKYKYKNICINGHAEGIIFRLRILQRVLSSSRSNDRLNTDHLAYQKLHKMIDYRGCVREPLRENKGNITIIMSPERFEALEAGNDTVPDGLATWLETLAQAHEALPPPSTCRGKRSTF